MIKDKLIEAYKDKISEFEITIDEYTTVVWNLEKEIIQIKVQGTPFICINEDLTAYLPKVKFAGQEYRLSSSLVNDVVDVCNELLYNLGSKNRYSAVTELYKKDIFYLRELIR